MRDRKNKCIIGFTTGIWFLSLVVFFWYMIGAERINGFAVGLYGVWNLVIFSTAYFFISRKVNITMGKVTACIQSMIDGKPVQNFSMQEESLLGKFQMQLKKLYEILDGSREYEETMRKDMSELVMELVHQVNTPLTNIQMYCGFLVEDDLPLEERKHICEIIDAQVDKLGWFAEGFTKTARLEQDIRKLTPAKQPILPMLLSAIDEISLKAQDHGNEVSLDGEQNIEAVYDRRWTEEAIFNLLDNGVKYSDPHTPIEMEMVAYDLYVRINIISYGQIIPKEEYPRIFKRFYRGENAPLVKEGVGLGLFLTRQIISGQGGYVKVGNRNGKANVFSVFLLSGSQ